MTSGETAWYYIINILSFGSLYFTKIAAKKALSECEEQETVSIK